MNTFPHIVHVIRNGVHHVKVPGDNGTFYRGTGLTRAGAEKVAYAKKEAMRPNVVAANLSTYPRRVA